MKRSLNLATALSLLGVGLSIDRAAAQLPTTGFQRCTESVNAMRDMMRSSPEPEPVKQVGYFIAGPPPLNQRLTLDRQ